MSYQHAAPSSPLSSPSPLKDTASWPRRRNPLPTSFLHHGLSPRRKQTSTFTSISKTTSSPINTRPGTPNGSFWDSDTASAYGGFSCSPNSDDPGDTLLALQTKQYKRTINDLTRRVESSENEISRHLLQITMLEEQIEDARRQTISDKQDFQHHKSIVRWQEEQLRIKQEEIVRMQKRHGSALRVSENKHRTLIDELKAKLASADDEIRQLTRRIKDMAKLLERSQIEEQECHQRCEYLDTQLSDARVFAAEASRLSADLTGQLSERAAYIGDLEQKILSLMSCFPSPPLTSTCLGSGDNRSVVLRQGNVAGCSRSGIISLHAEIAQATQLIGQSNMHSGFEFTKPSVAEPLLDDDHNCINNGNINNDYNTSGTTSCVLSSTA
ncbi:hypothetical protein GGF39_003882, partial [Coemansia sp. RSA 1721]